MNWIRWVDPVTGAIIAAILIPPLILLYFLKLRRKTHAIGSTLLWQKSIEDLRANAPFQRLRRSLLLLLQLLALALLALALMQPQLIAGSRRGGKVVLLIDNSASMTATDTPSGRTRLEEAKEEAKDLVRSLRGGGLFGGGSDEVMVIAFNERAEVHSNFTSSESRLISAIDAVGPTHAESSVEEALKLARAHTTVVNPDDVSETLIGSGATFELFSDGRVPDFAEQANRGETLNFHRVGSETPDNVAFANVAVERPIEEPGSVQVFVGVLNFNPEPVTLTIQLSVEGDVLDPAWVRDVPVEAAREDPATGAWIPGRSNVVFGPFPQPRDALVEVENLRPDDLAFDNYAAVVTPPPANHRVALVQPRSFLTKVALEGMPLAGYDVLTRDEFTALADDGGLERYDVIILEDVELDALPPGRYLSFGAPLPIPGFEDVGGGEGMLILNWEEQHPALRYVDLDPLVVGPFRRLGSLANSRVLAEGGAGQEVLPAIVEFPRGAVHALYLAFNHHDTNWFTHQSFLIFLTNAIEYLGALDEASAQQDLRPGEPISTRLPLAARDVRVTLPDPASQEGVEETVQVADPSGFSFSRTPWAGVYELAWDEPDRDEPATRRFAVNQFSSVESDLRPAELVWGGEAVPAGGEGGALQTPLWPWALALCLLLLMVEWWVYHRRTHV